MFSNDNGPEHSGNNSPHNATISTSTPSSEAAKNKEQKEKRNWFHSLTRRRKTQSQSSLNMTSSSYPDAAELRVPLQLPMNNNNDETIRSDPTASAATDPTTESPVSRDKEEKNVFQRLKKRMGIHLHSLRRQKRRESDGATTDASSEFVTQSPTREPHVPPRYSHHNILLEEPEIVPFTVHYKRFVAKKWLERDVEPNRVMYKASSEMLGQVWYWGEISRRDAQKQLTDKPTGSFLVRDSETSGSQFTLSFRIVNVTLHYRLEYRDNYWHFEELQYESIVEMIEDILFRCTNDNFVCFVRVPNEMQPPFPVILKYPLSRYSKIPHLQDLCRRVIQRHIPEEEIAKLPIPPKLHEYLCEKRELVF